MIAISIAMILIGHISTHQRMIRRLEKMDNLILVMKKLLSQLKFLGNIVKNYVVVTVN